MLFRVECVYCAEKLSIDWNKFHVQYPTTKVLSMWKVCLAIAYLIVRFPILQICLQILNKTFVDNIKRIALRKFKFRFGIFEKKKKSLRRNGGCDVPTPDVLRFVWSILATLEWFSIFDLRGFFGRLLSRNFHENLGLDITILCMYLEIFMYFRIQ